MSRQNEDPTREPGTQEDSGGLADKLGLEIHPTVFFVSAGVIIGFVLLSLIFLNQLSAVFAFIQTNIADNAGWFYILCVNLFLGFTVYLLCSRYGRIRLGGPDAKPEFSLWGWFAMLFSAGMGIGLLFFSVAEPIFHYATPPLGDEPQTVEAARSAMNMTFYHWGFHAWGVYALVGLALAFFAFNKGLPLTIRSVFYPILKERIHGPVGNLIDIFAVGATLFGVATSLGLGVQQVNAGLAHLLPVPQNSVVQIVLIALITAMATASVVFGLDKGIRRLSEFNMWVALTLLIFVLLLGPTIFLLNGLVQNIGTYIQRLPEMSFFTEAYTEGTWQRDWTIFYWAWWIAWSPFVGMFIARISFGRTIREFLTGVLFVPVILTFIWLTVFGDTALHEQMYGGGGIVDAVQNNIPIALFVLLERFPLSIITSVLSIVVVITFFVTSSDSGSLVIDIITAGGNTNPPVHQRIFWATLEGVVAAALLLGGGLTALQTASITTGLPFTVVLLLVAVSLHKGLRETYRSDRKLIKPATGHGKRIEAPKRALARGVPRYRPTSRKASKTT
ncbi:BCCT family transporter [bacterium]|nr:BCCT family transporter [bacterium]